MDMSLILALLYGILLAVVFQTFNKRRKLMKNHVKKVGSEEFESLRTSGQLIDVRSKEEYKAGKILGARNIPLNEFDTIEKKVLRNKQVLLYCASGKRAMKAASKLAKLDYTNIIVLKDSFDNYTGKKSN